MTRVREMRQRAAPLALQDILLAGCPTVGVRTGASFVRAGETGVVVGRLPPGRQCAESDEDVWMLDVFMDCVARNLLHFRWNLGPPRLVPRIHGSVQDFAIEPGLEGRSPDFRKTSTT